MRSLIVAVIRVGAPTESEMKAKKEALDDAINSTKAAVAEGIVPGGGLALLQTGDRIRIDLVKGRADILVSKVELARRRAALGYPAGIVQDPFPLDLTPGHVLANVVQVEVNGRAVPAGDPVAGRRVQGHLHRGTAQRLTADQGKQGVVDVLDHPEHGRPVDGGARRANGQSLGQSGPSGRPNGQWIACPIGQLDRPLLPHLGALFRTPSGLTLQPVV